MNIVWRRRSRGTERSEVANAKRFLPDTSNIIAKLLNFRLPNHSQRETVQLLHDHIHRCTLLYLPAISIIIHSRRGAISSDLAEGGGGGNYRPHEANLLCTVDVIARHGIHGATNNITAKNGDTAMRARQKSIVPESKQRSGATVSIV